MIKGMRCQPFVLLCLKLLPHNQGLQMASNPDSRAKAYGEKADECLRLAAQTPQSFIAAEYRRLASRYRELQGLEAAYITRMDEKPKDI